MRIVSLLALLCLVLTGCYVETDVNLDASDNLHLSSLLVSIDNGPQIIEASTRHALNVLGVRNAFEISESNPREFAMEDYLLIKAVQDVPMRKIGAGDKIAITPIGKQKKLEWLVEPRVQSFAGKRAGGSQDQLNEAFLVIRIHFPGIVETANTSENEGNTYIWRITQAQLTKPYKIQAVYSVERTAP